MVVLDGWLIVIMCLLVMVTVRKPQCKGKERERERERERLVVFLSYILGSTLLSSRQAIKVPSSPTVYWRSWAYNTKSYFSVYFVILLAWERIFHGYHLLVVVQGLCLEVWSRIG